uniref:non-specific serine/threonine protein kinase n=1 Tax=Aceria tosichella TaxID=561515 RepID=A0A6G1SMT6_9ACAR
MASGYYDITSKTLGKGHYGVVKLARHCLTGEPVAIKIIEKSRLNSDSLNQLGTEIRILFRLSEYEHPNILKLYQTIDTEHKLYLITEYCGPHACDLHDYLSRKQCRDGLSELEAQVFFIQICSAISYCHSMGIVHRDLKPENILVTDYKHMQTANDFKYPLLKLIDFGFANQWYADEKMRTSCGTLAYSAPELLLGEPYDGTKVDVWGLGLMLYILLYGGNPFMQINDNETLTKILDCSFATPARDNIDFNAIDLVRSLIKRNPDTRLPIDAILKHKWFSNAPKTLEFMLKYKLRLEQQTTNTTTTTTSPNVMLASPNTPTNLTNTKSLPKLVTQIVSSTTLPSISESGPLNNINRSVDDNQVLMGGDCTSETTKPSYNRTRSLSITRSYVVTSHQSNLPQARSSNNLEKSIQSPNSSNPMNTSPRPLSSLAHGSPLFRPTSPDVRGSVEPTEEEIGLHERVLQEIFRLTTVIDSKSSVEASLKNARFAHRQFNQNSIQPAHSSRRRTSTGLVRLLGQNKNGHHLESDDQQATENFHTYDLNDNRQDKLDKPSVRLSNDDYIYATYQLTRDKILRFEQEKIRRQANEDGECNKDASIRINECLSGQDVIPEEDTYQDEQGNTTAKLAPSVTSESSRNDQFSSKENDNNTRLQQRKLLQPQHKMRDKFTSFFRSSSSGSNGSLSMTHDSQNPEDGYSNPLETHHEAFSDHHTEMGSSAARCFGSKTDPYENSMAYALPLARKCSLVSEEGCSGEPQEN